MESDSEIKKEIKVTNVFLRTEASKATVIINVGGARSSKSYSIAQVIVKHLLTEENKKILICRKTMPALRMTTMSLVLDILKEYGIYKEERHNKTNNTYDYKTNRIQFAGLDESEKIKSYEANYIWMEEGNEFVYEDYVALKLRLSGACKPGEQNHLYISLNPVDSQNWIATRAAKEADVEVIKSTFLDNPFLSEAYKQLLIDLINQDEVAYRVYVLGEWGILGGQIYTNYEVIPELPKLPDAKFAYGLDFGDACSTLVKVYLWNGKFYLDERFYKSGWTTLDIIEHLSHEERADIYCDPSAKQQTNEVFQAGYMAYKGNDDVKAGIDLCKRQKIYIPQSSPNIIKEIRNYHRKKNPMASEESSEFLDDPVKYNDHTCDAMRYAIWGITERYGSATARPHNMEPIKSLTFKDDKNNKKVLDRWMKK